MGPKKADNTNKGNKTSLGHIVTSNVIGGGTAGEAETQLCIGKFAIDLEVCCRESTPPYPVALPIFIRGRTLPSSSSSQVQSIVAQSQGQNQSQQPTQPQPRSRPHSRTSASPSGTAVMNIIIPEEQSSSTGKKSSRPRKSSTASQGGIVIAVTGVDMESQSMSLTGQETLKTSSSSYKTFHIINDSEYYRPKFLVDLVNNENESIDQITALYMKAWLLDQQLIDILKKVLPHQEQLHTLNFCFVGLDEQTINRLVDLCHIIKNLKSLLLDGNPCGNEHFYRLIEKEDSKINHLSLRFCDISDKGAERLANALGNIWTQNWKLLDLNLTGNQIGDDGAIAFATALRYNRSLISLNLSSNLITDQGAYHLALVLRRIVLTHEEIVRRRYLLSQLYAELHPDEWRNIISSPTPSTVSMKSKSGRPDWKRAVEPNKRKVNSSKLAQIVVDRRNRSESDDSRPSSRNQTAGKQSRNENSGRLSSLNTPSANANASRRTPTGTSNSNNKDADQSRATSTARTKKPANVTSAAPSKKNIAIVKEEEEDASKQGRAAEWSPAGKFITVQSQQAEHTTPLIELNEAASNTAEIWLRGNLALLNLNLSRNCLTINSVKEFLLSIQQQTALAHLNDSLNLTPSSLNTTTSNSTLEFLGICRLELKGMNEISTKSREYQSLETLLIQKNPSIRFQQYRERELKELLETQSLAATQTLQPIVAEKPTNTNEKVRSSSSLKMAGQRPTSRLKD